MRSVLLSLLFLIASIQVLAQIEVRQDLNYEPGVILQDLHKLKVLGSVLYVAAHPDDENTRFLAYAENHLKVRAAYLSLTRGDGGQNLVGKEVSEKLGIIRTQELLAARRIDGAEQFFSRAVDFSYSKHPDETFNIWNRDQVLADAIWVIRKFRPDVIITRFSPSRAGLTHGHHTASAQIAVEAFQKAGDPEVFPEQLKHVEPWQAKRILWNTSWWFYRGTKFDDSKLIKIDAGAYNPLLGKSIGEIASSSRTMHKSQGFGSSMQRGSQIEYFEPLEGDGGDISSIFNFDHSWKRLGNENRVESKIDEIIEKFNPAQPSSILDDLVDLRAKMDILDKSQWIDQKMNELDAIILRCAGVFIDASADRIKISEGDSLKIKLRALNRTSDKAFLANIRPVYLNAGGGEVEVEEANPLVVNEMYERELDVKIPATISSSNPYWLNEKGSFGMFKIADQKNIGRPENLNPISVEGFVAIQGQDILFRAPVQYRSTDPVIGETYKPIDISPRLTVNFSEEVIILKSGESKEIEVLVKSFSELSEGEVKLILEDGWGIEPSEFDFSLFNRNSEHTEKVVITAPQKGSDLVLKARVYVDGKVYDRSFVGIEYDHFPTQSLYPKADLRIVSLNLNFGDAHKIGYINGAGDKVAESLRAIGFVVDILEDADMKIENLSQYDAIFSGIRAYNVNKRIPFYYDVLMEYINRGGNYIVQYNTSRRILSEKIGPYPLTLSRDRVTVEEAEVRFLDKKHKILNQPNIISSVDFEGWVHERGLYFPDEWDEKYSPIFGMNDPGEDEKKGSLLVATYGKGSFIYTGLSFFRELPAGVPGSYRLISNIINYKSGE